MDVGAGLTAPAHRHIHARPATPLLFLFRLLLLLLARSLPPLLAPRPRSLVLRLPLFPVRVAPSGERGSLTRALAGKTLPDGNNLSWLVEPRGE